MNRSLIGLATIQIQRITLKSGDLDGPVEIAQTAGNGPFPPVLHTHAKRGKNMAAVESHHGHMQLPNAPEPDQLFRIAPELLQITTPIHFRIVKRDFELRRINGGTACHALWERGLPVEFPVYPLDHAGTGQITPDKFTRYRHPGNTNGRRSVQSGSSRACERLCR